MSDSISRAIFAALCLIGLSIIIGATIFEVGRQKRSAAISQRHFRWRMISALMWMLILGSLSYATLFLWPANFASRAATRPFLHVVAGAMALMLFAFVLMLGDFYLTAKTRKLSQARREHNLEDLARREVERLRHPQREENGGAAEKDDSAV